MHLPSGQQVISPVLVGRTRQVQLLSTCLASAAGGQGGTVAIVGEAGVGKSRLTAEIMRLAEAEGWFVARGRCYEPDRLLPYAPLLDLLQTLLLTLPSPRIAAWLEPAAPALAPLLPELATFFPNAGALPASEPDQEQRRLAQALVQLFLRMAATQTLLLVLEDLHWSDESSLAFLLQLARRLAGRPILLLLTTRTDEAHAALNHLLAELARERLAVEVPLDRLSRDDVAAMVGAIFHQPQPVRREFVDALYALTDGNPFFVEESLKSLLAAGDIVATGASWHRKPLAELQIPRTIQDAVQRRLTSLSPAAQQSLRAAAVAGRRFDFPLLQALTGHDDPALVAQIKEMLAAQMVVEEYDGREERFAFRHALTRQAILAGMLGRERRALHGAIGEELERRHVAAGDPRLSDLADHFYAAQNWPKALDYAQRAADRARRLYAQHEVIEQCSRALDAAAEIAEGGDRVPAARLAELHRGRGLAFDIVGDLERARADHEAALRLAQLAGDRRAAWQSQLDLALHWASRDFARAGEYAENALDLARSLNDPALLAHSLNRVGNWHMNAHAVAVALRYHQEALAIFTELGDEQGMAATYALLGITCYNDCDFRLGTGYFQEAAARFGRLDDREGLVQSLTHQALPAIFDLEVLGVDSLATCSAPAETALAMARAAGWRAGEANALIHLGAARCEQGAFGAALVDLQTAHAIATEIDHRTWQIGVDWALGRLYMQMLAWDDAQRVFEPALGRARRANIGIYIYEIGAFLAQLHVARAEFARAEALMDELFGPEVSFDTVSQRRAAGARAALALARADTTAAQSILDELTASTRNLTDDALPSGLWRLRGSCALAAQRYDEALEIFATAAAVAEREGRRPLLWQLYAGMAAAGQALGRHDAAAAARVRARQCVEDLAAGIPDPALRRRFVTEATGLLPSAVALPQRQAAKARHGGLTAREREVAELIAQGLSNREIANSLVIAERTVAVHVGNILNKLGFSSRAQVARWVVERGTGDK